MTPVVLIFRHVGFEHPGLIAIALESAGIESRTVDLFENPEAPIELDACAGLLLMGGPMSANDPLEYLAREMELIRQAAARSVPVLGVCLGAQLIARAFGARVYRNRVKEIGWAPVYWTEAASSDPLFRGIPSSQNVFHWHGETFDLPDGAVHLALSDYCENQAFRLGSEIYGLQFHLEVTAQMIASWCAEAANAADVCELQTLPDSEALFRRMSEIASLVFGRWAAMLKKSA